METNLPGEHGGLLVQGRGRSVACSPARTQHNYYPDRPGSCCSEVQLTGMCDRPMDDDQKNIYNLEFFCILMKFFLLDKLHENAAAILG